MADLCDVNVLLALVTDRHVHHPEAARWMNRAPFRNAVVCRHVQIGLLRLLNNLAVMHEDAVPAGECWALWRRLLGDERVRFEPREPDGLDASFEAFTLGRAFSPRVWLDAYLAAYARAGDYTLVTFDQGFGQFEGLSCNVLTPPAR